jgi:phosphopantetheinyl transferase
MANEEYKVHGSVFGMQQLNWKPATQDWPPALTKTTIHVWLIDTRYLADVCVQTLYTWLSERERQRAQKLVKPAHRDTYILIRGACRDIISRYVAVSPSSIQFHYSITGKPTIGFPNVALEINLSTTGQLGLFALSWQEPLGVDCEQLCRQVNDLAIANLHSAPNFIKI